MITQSLCSQPITDQSPQNLLTHRSKPNDRVRTHQIKRELDQVGQNIATGAKHQARARLDVTTSPNNWPSHLSF
jgi:hypothetical protein